MLEEEKIIIDKKTEEINEEIDKKLSDFPLTKIVDLNTEQDKIVKDLIQAPSKESLQQQFDLFNLSQTKKNALRIVKLTNLMEKVEDQVIDRLTKRPDQISNRELIDAMTVVSNQIEKTQKMNDDILNTEDTPIKIVNTTNEVNINLGTDLSRDEKENVLDAVTALLKQVKTNPTIQHSDDEVIEIDEKDSEDIVYNIDEFEDKE